MLARRLLMAGRGSGGGSFVGPPSTLYLLYNGATASYDYKIGLATSTDSGTTWTKYASNPVLTVGGGGSWDSTYVKDPWWFWDGSQYVVYYTGYNGTTFAIGRATSPDRVTWTKYGGNPVVSGGPSAFDSAGAYFPNILYQPTLSPAYRMWVQAFPSGATPGNPTGISIEYLDSTDGISWTKRGQVLTATGSGFEADGVGPGGVVYDQGTYYIYYSGYNHAANKFKSAIATCTSPTGTYTRLGQVTGYTGNITAGSKTWQSNLFRTFIQTAAGLRAWGGVWFPTAGGEEGCFQVTATDLTTPAVASTIVFSLPGGAGWDSNSAENPSVIAAP